MAPPPKPEGKFAALPARIASAVALVIVAGGALFFGGVVWWGFLALCAAIMLKEWYGLTKNFPRWQQAAGLLYVGLPCTSLLMLQSFHAEESLINALFGKLFIVQLLAMVAATDIAAYFSGKLIGGAKLAPKISPNKTWAGLLGGMVGAMAVSVKVHSFGIILNDGRGLPLLMSLTLGALIAVLGQVGDMFESWLKRRAGVKDSGRILPGHGGLLDRFDGLTLTAPLYCAFVWLSYSWVQL